MNGPMNTDNGGLALETVGTALGDLVKPCAHSYPRHSVPALPSTLPAFAIALSGGGFRATLAAIGVLRFLADVGMLSRVRHVSSVSGGSIANGLFANTYSELEAAEFSTDAFVRHIEEIAVSRISRRSLTAKLGRNLYRTIGPGTRTTVLARALDDWFFHGSKLSALSPQCRFIFNSANLTTGVRFGFESDVVGDYVIGNVTTASLKMNLAIAVACSAAVPGFFPPYEVKAKFPCGLKRPPKVVDGGVYENTGTEPLSRLAPDEHCLVVLNSGGVFRTGGFGSLPVVRDLMRSESLLYRQSTALRTRSLVERFKLWEGRGGSRAAPPAALQGVLFALSTTVSATPEWLAGRPQQTPDMLDYLARLKTSFGRFSLDDCRELIYRGWWLTGATLSLFHRGLLPTQLPRWEQRV